MLVPLQRSAQVVALLSLLASARADSTGSRVEALTGRHTRVVWTGMAAEGLEDPRSKSDKQVLYGFDSGDGKGVRRLIPAQANYSRPLLTPDGGLVIFSQKAGAGQPEIAVYAARFGGGITTRLADGYAVDTWRDPGSGATWIYALDDFGKDAEESVIARRLVRFPLDQPEKIETIWEDVAVPLDAVEVSPDGGSILSAVEGGKVSLFEVASGTWTQIGPGGTPTFSAGASATGWILDPEGLTAAPTVGGASLALDESMRKGWRIAHPRWSNAPRFLALSGPYRLGITGASEICLGRMSAAGDSVEAWLQLTENFTADYFPDLWLGGPPGSGSRATSPTTPAPKPAPTDPANDGWPVSRNRAAFLWENGSPQGVRQGTVEALGKARLGRYFEMQPSEGAFRPDADSRARIDATLDPEGTFSIEFVLSGPPHKEGRPILRSQRLVIAEMEEGFVALSYDPKRDRLIYQTIGTLRPSRNGEPQSFVYVRTPEGETWYQNGRKASRSGTAMEASPTIRTGKDEFYFAGDRPIERVGIYARALESEEIEKLAESATRATSGRVDPPYLRAVGTLIAITPAPHRASMGSRKRVLVNYHYRIGQAENATHPLAGRDVCVLHWAMLDRVPVEGFPREVGKTYLLGLEPIEAHPELSLELVSDEIGKISLPQFLEVGERLQRPPPVPEGSKPTSPTSKNDPRAVPSIADRLAAARADGMRVGSSTLDAHRQNRAESAAMLKRRAALSDLERRMNAAAQRLDFERAIIYRDALFKLQEQPLTP